MPQITLPSVSKLIFENGNNFIIQSYNTIIETKEFEYISGNPFILKSSDKLYFFTSKLEDDIPDGCDYALLTTRKPRKKDFSENNLSIIRWLKHPLFEELTPQEVVNSWKGGFSFIKEDIENDVKGLRPPQIGALYSILAHCQNADERGIVVMPTGTGKTETMLSTLIANECEKLLVAVPSDSLRTQISEKFITLGLLKEFDIVSEDCKYPIVGVINQKFGSDDELFDFISKANVVVTTMAILAGCSHQQKVTMSENFSHLFVDEAHHSEASTWKKLIQYFINEKVFLFTATPFRNDGKKLKGKFIFNFSLKLAQSQGYYKKINFLPIREYDKDTADKKIAKKAVEQLRKDIAEGYNHIIMARCITKDRAKKVFEYYSEYEDLKPILVYTGIAGLKDRIEAIKSKVHKIVVCVNMLGEGFDLPELKIAAIHDERQSLPITLQFVGRFTRTSFDSLGNASFITNMAYPPIQKELSHLYAKDADWNLLLPMMSEESTEKEINFQEFLSGFRNLENSSIPFQNINPAMSTIVYKNSSNTWSPNNWKEGITNISTYEHQLSNYNEDNNTLVIILGKVNKVEWGDFDVVKNMEWNMIVVHWDYRPNKNLVFIHSSAKGVSGNKLMSAIFDGAHSLIDSMDVFKIFHDVKRLTLYNVGARKGIGKDISFQSFFGRGVQDGIKQLEQGTLIKNNFFGVGFKEGEKISLGCSAKGKIWSYLRGNLNELVEWCKIIGDTLEDPNIDPNTVLENTLIPISISERPNVFPTYIDWHPDMYQYAENRYEVTINGKIYDLSNSEINIIDTPQNQPIRFSFNCEDFSIVYEFILGSREVLGKEENYYEVRKLSVEKPIITFGNKMMELTEFFQDLTPTIWFADGSHLFQNKHVKPKEKIDKIPLSSITIDDWEGVSINKEAQGISPYVTESIQYYFIDKIKEDFQIIYDDDGRGEIADIIGINDNDNHIDIHLFHLKYAKGGAKGNDISNFYEVCGQAQKSLSWKYRERKVFFDHLLRRVTKRRGDDSCSRIIKGTEEQLELLLTAASWRKEMKFHIYIVQPSLRKNNASDDILLLLGNTHHYLHTMGDVELKVITS